MAWTDVAPWLVGQATKISFFNKLLDNTKFHRDSSGDFASLPIGTGLDGSAAAPILAWKDSPGTGLFRSGVDQLGISAAGVKKINVSASLIDIQTALKAISLQLGNPLPVTQGGTGGITPALARQGLGITKGVFTPTISPISGINTSSIATNSRYIKIDKIVTVSGMFTAQTSLAATGQYATLALSLPPGITPAMVNSLSGSVVQATLPAGANPTYFASQTGPVTQYGTSGAMMNWISSNAAHPYDFSYIYQIELI